MKSVFGVFFALTLSFSSGVYSHSTSARPDMIQIAPTTSIQKRVALLIGNKDYNLGNLERLTNPVNDADDLAVELRKLGFEVTIGRNVKTKPDMVRLIIDWGRNISNGGIALFFYSGHGLQIDGSNYLLPVSVRTDCAKKSPAACVQDQAVDLETVLGAMATPDDHVNIVILDACRSKLRDVGFRRGLAPVVGSRGTYIAYATAPGDASSDGFGRNGLFTGHLLKRIGTPDLRIEDMFRFVRRDVANDDRNHVHQLPWDASSLMEQVILNPSCSMPAGCPTPSPSPQPSPTKPTIPNKPRIEIRITIFPPSGGGPESSATIGGQVSGVDPRDFMVLLYSLTDKWYVQPTRAEPFTDIGKDGKWEATIHLGTRYAAILVRRSFDAAKVAPILIQLPDVGDKVLAVAVETGKTP